MPGFLLYSLYSDLFLVVVLDDVDEDATVEFGWVEFLNTTNWFNNDIALWES